MSGYISNKFEMCWSLEYSDVEKWFDNTLTYTLYVLEVTSNAAIVNYV